MIHFKQHQLPHIQKGIENFRKSGIEARQIIDAEDISLIGSIYGKYGILDPLKELDSALVMSGYFNDLKKRLWGTPLIIPQIIQVTPTPNVIF